MPFYANGLGGTTGSSIATDGQAVTSSPVVYVHCSGTLGNSGYVRTSPIHSLDAAFTTSSAAGRVFCVLAGHTEVATLTTAHKGVTIIGEGEGDSRPALTGGTLSVTTGGFMLDSFRFINGATFSGADAQGLRISNCSFLASPSTTAFSVTSSTQTYARIENSYFNSTTGAACGYALFYTGALGGLTIENSSVPIPDLGACPTWTNAAVGIGIASLRVNNLVLDAAANMEVTASNIQLSDSSSQKGSWVSI